MAQPDPDRYRFYAGDRISADQREILKDRTGFESYTSYLIDHTRKYPSYAALLNNWVHLDNPIEVQNTPHRRYNCDIFDMTKDKDSSITFSICCSTNSYSELFTVLSEPRKGVCARIMLWRKPNSHQYHSAFLEDLGPALRISPAFFKSVYETPLGRFRPGFDTPVTTPSHAVFGDRVATMTCCCISENSSAIPILFIADTTEPKLHPWSASSELNPVFQQRMQPGWPNDYLTTIMRIIELNSVFSTSADTLILPALLAALQIEASNLTSYCCTLSKDRFHKTGNLFEVINKEREELHRRIEDFEDVLQDAGTYFSALYGADWSHDYNCESIVEYFTLTINRARRFEDRQIGQLSLEEAQKSIELSTSQIEEGKRGELYVNCIKELPLIHPSQDM